MKNNLSEKHLEKLKVESVISDDVIESRGYRTITKKSELSELGFAASQQRVPALLLPVCPPDGLGIEYQIRPDNPRPKPSSNGKPGKGIIKYEYPKDAKMRLDCPPICREMLSDPKIPIWITEGIPKGDSLASRGACAVSLLGVWNFKGKNEFDGVAILTDLDSIAWNGRDARIVFDSDVMQKPGVRKALVRLTEILQRRKASVSAVYLPNGKNGEKVGVDDFFRDHTLQDLENLVNAPRPIAQPAPATIELLDEAPDVMRRPMQIIKGRAYAATWLHVKRVVRETLDQKTGDIIKHDPPIETKTRQLFIMRDDGKMFGDGAECSLSEIGFDVCLPEELPDKNVMSKKAVESYRANQRPDPIQTFIQIRNVFDRFLDFNRSLADQTTMCELSACFVLATWFTEGFNIAGYVWATGEKGSGKTQFLLLVCELAYLGQFIQASGSMASLRDLSDYGAFLGFDDAEQVADKNFDPDKRNILLSGFRRGSQITVKEPDPKGRGWKTRYVNTFTFRGFTATRKPDDILASRAISYPLVRTSNKFKGDADPLDFSLWEQSPKQFLADLWQIGLEHISKIPNLEREARTRASLTGRDLEQWICVLTVALFLDSIDTNGMLLRAEDEKIGGKGQTLFERINRLSIDYQSARSELESNDLTRLVLRSIVRSIDADIEEPYSIEKIKQKGREWCLSTDQITKNAHFLIEKEELDFNVETTNSKRIGKKISALRIRKDDKTKTRGWSLTLSDLKSLLASYSLLELPELPKPNVTNVTNVINVMEDTFTNDVNDVNDVCDVSNHIHSNKNIEILEVDEIF
jgi:hypothetical protein